MSFTTTLRSLILTIVAPNPRQIVIAPPDNLVGQVVLVTGAAGQIGQTLVKQFLALGARVIAVDLDQAKLDKTFTSHPQLLCLQADIQKEADVQAVVSAGLKKFGQVDVLINNAGIFLLDKNLETLSVSEFEAIMNVNVKGMFLFCKALLPSMKKRHHGLIINIGSKISHNTNVTGKKVMYATTKYAVEGFSQALQSELFGTGIRVTCLMSATVSTFQSLQSKKYLETAEIASVIAHIIAHPHISYEHLLIQSVDQRL